MCGRFVATHSADRIAEFFGASFDGASVGAALPANYNVAPTHDVHAVVQPLRAQSHDAAEPVREVQTFHWGLVPSWAKDTKIGSKMINARAETIAEKPAFKGLLRKHRLLIPMDGFYEWQGDKGAKTPMYIHRIDGEPLAVAGLWAIWRDRTTGPDAPWLHSCTVITTAANATMAPVHDRMPVILPRSLWADWLDPRNGDTVALQSMLQPAADDVLTMYAVSTQVNNVRNKGPELTHPASAPML
jgi:putative SOS response-associated peptidase YedK